MEDDCSHLYIDSEIERACRTELRITHYVRCAEERGDGSGSSKEDGEEHSEQKRSEQYGHGTCRTSRKRTRE